MELDESTKLLLAQRFISDLLQKLSQDPATQIDTFEWGRKEMQYGTEVYTLTVILDGKLRTLNLAEEELTDETPEVRERLRRKIEGFLREMG